MTRRFLGCVAIVASVLWCAPGWAQEQAINSLDVDFFTGPVVNSGRVIGLGGAYVSVAEGADGHLVNPVAYGLRYVHDADDWFSWDFSFSGIDDVGSEDQDLDLSGRGVSDAARYGQAGINMKFGKIGVGIQGMSQSFDVDVFDAQGSNTYTYDQQFLSLGGAYNFRKGEILIGAALLAGTATIREKDAGTLEMLGGGLQIGVLWVRPDKKWRLGFSWRSPIRMIQQDSDGNAVGVEVEELGQLRVPKSVVVPWELAFGGSYLIGPREYNVVPTFGRWKIQGVEKPVRLKRRVYLLLSSDLVISGNANNAIGVQDFLSQGAEQFSGKTLSASPRLGAESEIWEDVMVVRLGTYFEPSRFDRRFGRIHGTGGIDFHVPLYWEWKVGATFDVSENYSNIGVGVGFWH